MGEPNDLFTERARALAQALDEWEVVVGKVIKVDKQLTRSALISRLKKQPPGPQGQHKHIDAPLLTAWLKGRDQLREGSRGGRLPTEEDCAAIARALKEEAPGAAEQLPRIGKEISVHLEFLKTKDPEWRKRLLASLTRETVPSEPLQEPRATDPAATHDKQMAGQADTPATTSALQAELAGTTSQPAGRKQGGRKIPWFAGGLGVAVAAAAVVWVNAQADNSDRTPEAAGSNTPTESDKPTPKARAAAESRPPAAAPSASATTSTPYFAGTPHCRMPMPVDDGKHHAKINPCIAIDSNNRVRIWSDYTAEETGTFTVYIWLADAVNADRVPGIYVRCPVTFTHVGQQQTSPCEKSGITPPSSKRWVASMVVEPGTAQTPDLWTTNYKGTQGGSVMWNG
ncbi:hypothetical protein [Streptomyces sp. NPDC006333]|uniref:hypothetical protein n=1 Tax=Streptomyces sp. NPDC006333 TaxID=3156753 RepID=UPI0033A7303D